ncbi:hypothetical protein DTO027B5_4838 [Paecilomyces variotii]|nr:hypothetical protein DTO169C6_8111 [Paecilomyces variotii]KAJ9248127.1 hypothetical protein DTO207G8_7568 [Paecilomyces variotii]KAJ9250311.1 hypothetical protein DTO195F2_8186 [Paecilomyces variotii]KAJ9322739.1 hypothetical protein DTO027B3_6321 [Paecilomyces variotii]KAJ9333468.1 hypothetical protein DTO027B5_4838 [Paecilomyces variotii]
MYPSEEDPQPPFPYTKGWIFHAQTHISPPPTPVTYNCCLSTTQEREDRERLGKLRWCLDHPPLSGEMGAGGIDLEIQDAFRVGDRCNAQVFTAKVLQAPPNFRCLQPGKEIITKIYDPLYFNDEGGYINPFRSVDKHYTHEARTYDVLSDIQGQLIPTFYGSYTSDIPVDGHLKRTVRLILLDYIPGTSMQQVNPKDFSQQTRQQIMRSIVDFETLIFQRNIALTDLSPRNIVMKETLDLIFIDFAGALFGRTRDDIDAKAVDLLLGQYISPLLRWPKRMMRWEFNDWIDWDWKSWLQAEYAHTTATITAEMRKVYG